MSTRHRHHPARNNMTLTDLINQIAADPTLQRDRQRWRTAIEGIARGLGKPPGMLPAAPERLALLLSKQRGARHLAGVREGTWKTYKAQYRAATRHVGLAKGPARIDTPRSPAWKELLATRSRSERTYLSRFAGVMTEQGVPPSEVTPAHFAVYRDYVRSAAVRDPEKAYHGACAAWRRVLNDNPKLQQCSPPRAYRRSSYWRAWSEFPSALEAEIDAYYAEQQRPQSVDTKSLFTPAPSGSRRGGKGGPGIRPSTTRNYKNYLQALASAAVEAGTPAQSLDSLGRLVSPAVHEPAVHHLLRRLHDDQRQRGVAMNRPWFAGGSNSQIGWGHDESDDEQVFSGSPRPGGADGAGARRRASLALGRDGFDSREVRLLAAHAA